MNTWNTEHCLPCMQASEQTRVCISKVYGLFGLRHAHNTEIRPSSVRFAWTCTPSARVQASARSLRDVMSALGIYDVCLLAAAAAVVCNFERIRSWRHRAEYLCMICSRDRKESPSRAYSLHLYMNINALLNVQAHMPV